MYKYRVCPSLSSFHSVSLICYVCFILKLGNQRVMFAVLSSPLLLQKYAADESMSSFCQCLRRFSKKKKEDADKFMSSVSSRLSQKVVQPGKNVSVLVETKSSA